MGPLEIVVGAGDDGLVIRLSGEADLTTAEQLRDALRAQLAGGCQHLIIDLSELRFADSATVRILIETHRTLRNRGGVLELARPQLAVAKSLSLLGVDKVLPVRPRA